MRDQAPEGGGFEFRSGFVVKGHGRYPAVAEAWYYVDLVIESAKDSAKHPAERQYKQGFMGSNHPAFRPPAR
jgi:hypothetical protein